MIVPEHRPTFYVMCDECGCLTVPYLGTEQHAWWCAAEDEGFVRTEQGEFCSTECSGAAAKRGHAKFNEVNK